LDSFDEIPSILDAEEKSEHLRIVSRIVAGLIESSQHLQGVIASRYFKRPVLSGQVATTLDIRPFTEDKIKGALERTRRFPRQLLDELFQRRPDLVAIAQNPFSAAMVAEYVKDAGTLPARQTDLFADTITKRLHTAESRIRSSNLTIQDVENGAIDVAFAMFTKTAIGLDASTQELAGVEIRGGAPENITEALGYAKIGRFSPGPQKRFSFVHRRFHEYFLVRKLQEVPSLAELRAIPTDSRWRDALTLYCEVAGDEQARAIADFCWEKVQLLQASSEAMTDEDRFGAVHCLRFLRDAFANRTTAIAHFRHNLEAFLSEAIENAHLERENFKSYDLLYVKILVEAIGLLERESIQRVVQRALELDNAWISETALRSCRTVNALDRNLEFELARFIMGISTDELRRRFRELDFSMSLSQAFSNIRGLLEKRYRGVVKLWNTIPVFFLLAAPVMLCALVIHHYFHKSMYFDSKQNKKFQRKETYWDDSMYLRLTIIAGLMFPIFFSFLTLPYFFVDLVMQALTGVKIGSSEPVTVSTMFNAPRFLLFSTLSWPLPLYLGFNSERVQAALNIPSLFTDIAIVNWLLFVCATAALVVPWYIVIYRNLLIPARGQQSLVKGIVYRFFAWAMIAPIPGIVLRYLIDLWWWLTIFIYAFAGSGLALAAAGISFTVFRGLRRSLSQHQARRAERERLSKLTLPDRVSRTLVADLFNSFQTSSYRLRFVQKLVAAHPQIEGAWPGGRLPATGNDPASILLAQWEERERGLD
jgi:hypothetical protein